MTGNWRIRSATSSKRVSQITRDEIDNTEMLTDGRADIADPFYNVIRNDLKIAAVECTYLYQKSSKYLKLFSAKHHSYQIQDGHFPLESTDRKYS